MKENFDELIEKIENDLPDLITNEQLLSLGLGSHIFLFRLRQRNIIPFIKTSYRIFYLKTDVIAWLKKSYNTSTEDCLEECVSNEK